MTKISALSVLIYNTVLDLKPMKEKGRKGREEGVVMMHTTLYIY